MTNSAEQPVVTKGMPIDLFLVRHGESEGNVALNAAKAGDTSLMTEQYRSRSTMDRAAIERDYLRAAELKGRQNDRLFGRCRVSRGSTVDERLRRTRHHYPTRPVLVR